MLPGFLKSWVRLRHFAAPESSILGLGILGTGLLGWMYQLNACKKVSAVLLLGRGCRLCEALQSRNSILGFEKLARQLIHMWNGALVPKACTPQFKATDMCSTYCLPGQIPIPVLSSLKAGLCIVPCRKATLGSQVRVRGSLVI